MQQDFLFVVKCDKATNGAQKMQQEIVCDEVESVKGFCCLGNRLNASIRCKAAVTTRTRVG